MLSLKNITAGGARKYYESAAGEYYNKDSKTNEWQGQIAKEFGLEGKNVNFADFEKFAHGKGLSGEKLVRGAGTKKHMAGFDFTFSAPKSVSILAMYDPKILEAHREAVTNTLNHIEKNYIQTRVMQNGERRVEDTGRIIVAKFEHHANRNQEAQVHTHCAVMNVTIDLDGRFKTIHNRVFYQNQKEIGQLYRYELAKELIRKGYAIEITDQTQGFFKIKGVSDEMIKAFSTRTEEVNGRANELRKIYKGMRESKLKEHATIDTRTKKTKILNSKQMEDSVNNILKEFNTCLKDLQQSTHQIAKEIENKHIGKVDVNYYLKEAISAIEENQSAWKKSTVLAHTARMTLGVFSIEDISKSFDKQIKGNHISIVGDKNNDKYYSSLSMQKVEERIIGYVKEGKGKSGIYISDDQIKRIIENSNAKFTPGQKDALTLMTTSNDRIIAIQGDAGTGKTFVMKYAREIFEKNGYIVRGFAPTGKAVQELELGSGIKSQTVSSYLLKASKQIDVNNRFKGEVWIVDEAGMIGSKKMEQILEKAESKNAKVVLTGDKKQFDSIDQGKVFKDLQEIKAITFAEMRDIRRQETEHTKTIVKCFNEYIREFNKNNPGGKLLDVNEINKSKKGNQYIQEAFEILKNSNSIREDSEKGGWDERVTLIKKEYFDSLDKKQTALIITNTNSDRVAINQAIRTDLKEKGLINKDESRFQILSSIGLTGINKMYAQNYQVGYKIFFQQKLDDISKGTRAEVIAIDVQKNNITVKYQSKNKIDKEVIISLDSATNTAKIQVFAKNERDFSIGDKVILCKNDKQLGIKNGQIAIIKEVNLNGECTLSLGSKFSNKEVKFNLSENGRIPYPYIDHAYALTDYKSQGTTVEKLIWSIESNAANLQAGYVAVTRTREEIKVFTDSIKELMKNITVQSPKTSTLEFKKEMEKEREISKEKTVEIDRGLSR